jgi:hypothetical protein
MRRNLSAALLVFSLVLSGCESARHVGGDPHIPAVTPAHVVLDCIDFMEAPRDSIAARLAGILDIQLSSGCQAMSPHDLPVKTGMQWIEAAYAYSTSDGARIIIAEGEGSIQRVWYDVVRLGPASEDWSYGLDRAVEDVTAVLGAVGIALDGSEDLDASEAAAGRHCHWFSIELHQSCLGDALEYPGILAEVDGTSGRLNFLMIGRWYSNISDIEDLLPPETLADLALSYFTASPEVISIPDPVHSYGLDAIRDRLCANMGRGLTTPGPCASSLFVYLDAQTGDVVDSWELRMRCAGADSREE